MPPSYYQDTPSYNKSESDSTPEEKKKDPMYLAKRHKNNLAAQKSRKIRRQREESITKTAEMLRAENDSLKSEIVQLREMITDLRKTAEFDLPGTGANGAYARHSEHHSTRSLHALPHVPDWLFHQQPIIAFNLGSCGTATHFQMITDLRKQLSSTCQAPAPTEPMRDTANITRPDAYMPYHTFQIGFSINSQL
ncbi:basic region leucine zipper [Cooperia oncophora]